MESNPGPGKPGKDITIVTQNCRGIKDHHKLKAILNNSYRLVKQADLGIVCLQETMIKKDKSLGLSWRGNYVFTPGSGHGRGCVTLLSERHTPNVIAHLQERGHILSIQRDLGKLIVANIYAPTGQSREKYTFFTELIDKINEAQEPGDDVIIAGDYNTVFKDY